MKRVPLLWFAGALLCAALPLTAQDETAAAARAQQQDLEERLKRQNAILEEVQATQDAQRRRIDSLVSEFKSLGNQIAHANDNAVSREELKQLAEKLRELDQKREADKRLILEELQKLSKAPAAAVPEKRSETEPPLPPRNETGYEYVIQPGDTLSDVIAAFREKGVKVSLKQVLDANPGLDPKKLKKGQKVFIPAPTKS